MDGTPASHPILLGNSSEPNLHLAGLKCEFSGVEIAIKPNETVTDHGNQRVTLNATRDYWESPLTWRIMPVSGLQPW